MRLQESLHALLALLCGEPASLRHQSRPSETTLIHRDGRHGLALREDGTTDLFSHSSSIGLSRSGLTIQAPAAYLQTRGIGISAYRVALDTPPDGLVLCRRTVSPRLLQGMRVCAQHQDALVLIHPVGAPRPISTEAERPVQGYSGESQLVVRDGLVLSGVPLSSLFEHEPFSLPAEEREIDRQLEVLKQTIQEEW